MAAVMKVDKVFRFEGGRTVFAGVITPDVSRIGAVSAELWVAGRRVSVLALEGEMMPSKRAPNDKRAVATTAPIEVAEADVDAGRCELRFQD